MVCLFPIHTSPLEWISYSAFRPEECAKGIQFRYICSFSVLKGFQSSLACWWKITFEKLFGFLKEDQNSPTFVLSMTWFYQQLSWIKCRLLGQFWTFLVKVLVSKLTLVNCVCFSKNVNSSKQLGFNLTSNLGQYLRLPLLHEKCSASKYQYIIDNMANQLNRWNVKISFLSKEDYLSSLSSYIYSKLCHAYH